MRVIDIDENGGNARFEVLPLDHNNILIVDQHKAESTIALRQLLDQDVTLLKRIGIKQMLNPRQVANTA